MALRHACALRAYWQGWKSMSTANAAHLSHDKLCDEVDFQLLPQFSNRLICQGIKPYMDACKLRGFS